MDAVPVAELSKAPSVTITNGQVTARVFLPDAQKGFYRGPRFDWAGLIGSLTYRGHDFYTPWFSAMSPSVRDFVFEGGHAIASANTAATGPVEEFNADGGALGYADAAPGGLFLKIGVGVLRRTDDSAYTSFKPFPIVESGTRTVVSKNDQVVLRHEIAEPGSGYGYAYSKSIRLEGGLPVMVIEHELRNTGRKTIDTLVYDHNFLNIDGRGTTAGLEIETPFALSAEAAPPPELAEVQGKRFVYRASLQGDQRVSTRLAGYGTSASDYNFHIVDRPRGVGLRITGDRPLERVVLWSIQPVMSIEPFIKMSIPPGETFRWSYRYEFEAPATGR